MKTKNTGRSHIVVTICGLIMALAIGTGDFAFARGTVGGGGGVVWQCGWDSEVKKTYLADVAILESVRFNAKIFQEIELQGIDFLRDMLNARYPGLGDVMKKRVGELKFVGTNETIEFLNDDELPENAVINDAPCKKAQLAKQTFATGVVDYNIALYEALSPAGRVIFKVHESLVSLQMNQTGSTAPIRAEILEAVNANLFNDFESLWETHCAGSRIAFCRNTNFAGYSCVLDRLKNGAMAANARPTSFSRICDGAGCDPKTSTIPVYANSVINLRAGSREVRITRRLDTSFPSTGMEDLRTGGRLTSIERLSRGSAEFSTYLEQFGSEQTSGMSAAEREQVTLIKIYHNNDASQSVGQIDPAIPAPAMLIRFFDTTKQIGGTVVERDRLHLASNSLVRVCNPSK